MYYSLLFIIFIVDYKINIFIIKFTNIFQFINETDQEPDQEQPPTKKTKLLLLSKR
jgi:hypothetical protein